MREAGTEVQLYNMQILTETARGAPSCSSKLHAGTRPFMMLTFGILVKTQKLEVLLY